MRHRQKAFQTGLLSYSVSLPSTSLYFPIPMALISSPNLPQHPWCQHSPREGWTLLPSLGNASNNKRQERNIKDQPLTTPNPKSSTLATDTYLSRKSHVRQLGTNGICANLNKESDHICCQSICFVCAHVLLHVMSDTCPWIFSWDVLLYLNTGMYTGAPSPFWRSLHSPLLSVPFPFLRTFT